jgi:putative sensor protein
MTSIALPQPAKHRRAFPSARDMAHDAAYLVLGLPVGVAAFSVIVTGLALAAGLAITLVGVPILLATLVLARGIAELERRGAAPILGEPIVGRERPLEGGLWQRTKTIATDPASWRDAAWSLLALPVGVAGFTAAVTLWATALGFLTSPLYMWATPNDGNDLPFFNDPGAGYSVLRVMIGLALVPIAAWGSRALAAGFARLARAVLA